MSCGRLAKGSDLCQAYASGAQARHSQVCIFVIVRYVYLARAGTAELRTVESIASFPKRAFPYLDCSLDATANMVDERRSDEKLGGNQPFDLCTRI
jgi:hypothetical protein